MCSPVQTPVDPALASALASFCVGRALRDIERLGVGPPRGGSSRVSYVGDTVVPVPDGRAPWGPAGRRLARRLRTAAERSGGAVANGLLGGEGAAGTATLLRTTAHKAVSGTGWDKADWCGLATRGFFAVSK